ncbi:MAG: hypothetical protein ACRERV_06735 [Methylococcales bacterium]
MYGYGSKVSAAAGSWKLEAGSWNARRIGTWKLPVVDGGTATELPNDCRLSAEKQCGVEGGEARLCVGLERIGAAWGRDGCWADGSFFKANASKESIYTQDRLNQQLQARQTRKLPNTGKRWSSKMRRTSVPGAAVRWKTNSGKKSFKR